MGAVDGAWAKALSSRPVFSKCNAVVLALVFLPPAMGRGDSRPDWKQKPPGRFHAGPFWLTPKIALVNAGVDTNVNHDFANPVSDTAVVLRPSLRIALPVGRRVRLQTNGYTDFNYFRRQSTERTTDSGLDGRGELDFGPFTLSGGGGFAQDRLRYVIDSDERLRREDHFGFAAVDLRVGRTIEIRSRADVHGYRHTAAGPASAALPRTLDRDSASAKAELRYELTALTTLSASAEVIEDTFVGEAAASSATRSYRALGGFDFGEKAMLSGTVRVGVRQFPRSSNGTARSYSGPAFKVETTARVLSFGRLRVSADGDVYFAVSARPTVDEHVRNTYVSRRYQVGLDADLPFGLVARSSFTTQRARYLADYTVGQGVMTRVDRLYSAHGTLLRRIGDSFGIGGAVTWTERVSNLAGYSYEGWRYGLSAEIAP